MNRQERNRRRAERIALEIFDQFSDMYDALCECWICKEIRLLHLKKDVAKQVNHEK